MAQSAARQSHNLKVVSSSLTGGTLFFFLLPSGLFFLNALCFFGVVFAFFSPNTPEICSFFFYLLTHNCIYSHEKIFIKDLVAVAVLHFDH